MIIQKEAENTWRLILMDPGYLAPKGVETVIRAKAGNIIKAVDMISGEIIKAGIKIEPGAFRVVRITTNQ
jgi:hypothetical protein